jgi:hypothetical protein
MIMCRTCSNMAHKTDFSAVRDFKIFVLESNAVSSIDV